MKHNALPLILLGILSATSCAVPFSVDSDSVSLVLPNTYGIYVENGISVPAEAKKSGVSFSEVTLYYTVTKTDPFAADVSLYVSPVQTVDNTLSSNDEKILDVHLPLDQNSVSGTTTSSNILNTLNSGFDQIVVGAKNFSLSPLSSITVDVTIHLQGDYALF